MVAPAIDHGNSAPDTRVGGLFRACQSSPTSTAYLSLCTRLARTQLSMSIFQLAWWKCTMIPLAARILYSRFPTMMNVQGARLSHAYLKYFKLEIFLDGYAHPKIIPYEMISHQN